MGIRVTIDESRFAKRFAQKYEPLLAHQVARLCDPYVPFDTGVLKNSARVVGGSVMYSTPYTRRQYYEHKGDGLRGARWERRMMRAKGNGLAMAMQAIIRRS